MPQTVVDLQEDLLDAYLIYHSSGTYHIFNIWSVIPLFRGVKIFEQNEIRDRVDFRVDFQGTSLSNGVSTFLENLKVGECQRILKSQGEVMKFENWSGIN